MCTAIRYQADDHYFGRNLDLEYSYHETVVVTPRNKPLSFRFLPDLTQHYAMIGMAYVVDDYPLYYEATNEKGLSLAGLNFPASAFFGAGSPDKDHVAPFELIPWILSKCSTVKEARPLLEKMDIVNEAFRPDLPVAPLHWILDDKDDCLILESTADGLHIYENPIGVLTNEPPFPMQSENLARYRGLSPEEPKNSFAPGLNLTGNCHGMGSFGLPGDLSSPSRFVRAAFMLNNSVSGNSESEAVSQFFHVLASVAHPRGSVRLGEQYEITVYSSCCNADQGVYYYTTYENNQISAVDMHKTDLESKELSIYPLIKNQQFAFQN
ncbi:choloylglycine hydrolase [Hominifimenecus sp. rT4P-3]|uniref:choloylglycine hydrolase n=1 Tax=Hominifimenecus sp. rT4P-3 TaxID=3242979 RepID=UPI003DA57EA9